jgi:hypothetical protein
MSSGTTPKDAMSGICGPGAGPQAVSPCQKTHWVKVRLTFRDDKTNVSAAVGKITLGAAAIAPGPLANGVLEARNVNSGSYEASFPDIDADEWAKG